MRHTSVPVSCCQHAAGGVMLPIRKRMSFTPPSILFLSRDKRVRCDSAKKRVQHHTKCTQHMHEVQGCGTRASWWNERMNGVGVHDGGNFVYNDHPRPAPYFVCCPAVAAYHTFKKSLEHGQSWYFSHLISGQSATTQDQQAAKEPWLCRIHLFHKQTSFEKGLIK